MYDKRFSNIAEQPLQTTLVAITDDFGLVSAVRHYRGYHIGLNDEALAEAERMRLWAQNTFVGQNAPFFLAHNGVVPSPRQENVPPTLDFETFASQAQPGKSEALGRRYVVLNGVQGLDVHKIAEAMLTAPGILDLLKNVESIEKSVRPPTVNVDFTVDTSNIDTSKFDSLVANLRTRAAWLGEVPLRSVDERIYTKDYSNAGEGPIPGTYWQSRTEPTRFFKMTSATHCLGHWHVEMHCLQDGEPEDRVWIDDKQWRDIFAQVDRTTAHAPLSPQSSVGPHTNINMKMPIGRLVFPDLLKRQQEKEVERVEPLAEKDSHGNPLFRPDMFDARDAAQPVVAATQQVLDGVPFNGTEKPPAEGEQYQRVDSGRQWTVVSVVPGDFGVHVVTMEAQEDPEFGESYRAKTKFRSHAQWLAKWRPLDSEGRVKPVEFVDLEDFVDAALDTDAMAMYDAQAHADVREMMLTEGDNAVRWIRAIGRELDRRVPNWREETTGHVLYDDCNFIVRAIRTLNRRATEAEQALAESQKQVKAQLQMAEHHNKEKGKFTVKIEQRDAWTLEAAVAATKLFKNIYGLAKTKQLLQEFGAANLPSIPAADLPSWVRKLREYAGDNIP